MKTSWTILAITSGTNAVRINPHRFCDKASRIPWVWNYHDMHGPIQQNDSFSTITRDGCMNSS